MVTLDEQITMIISYISNLAFKAFYQGFKISDKSWNWQEIEKDLATEGMSFDEFFDELKASFIDSMKEECSLQPK